MNHHPINIAIRLMERKICKSIDKEEVISKQVFEMIKDLVDEIEQDSGFHFDRLAVEALQDAVKDIVTKAA